MLVADVDLGTIGQRHDGHRLRLRVQRMHVLKIVQDDIEGCPAKCGRTSHPNIDASLVAISEHQRLAIAHAEEAAMALAPSSPIPFLLRSSEVRPCSEAAIALAPSPPMSLSSRSSKVRLCSEAAMALAPSSSMLLLHR